MRKLIEDIERELERQMLANIDENDVRDTNIELKKRL